MAKASDKNLREEILTDDMRKLMIRMSIPAIIAMSINGINAFVDALFVGQLVGQDALAAISLAFPLTMLTNGFTSMIGIGTSTLLSRAIGANDLEVQRKSFGTLNALSLIISVLLTCLGVYFARDLIAFMGGTGTVLELGTTYYRITMIGAVLRVFSVAANMLIRAEGKLKEAMIMSGSTAIINMILNPIFIGVLGWGIAGAAWATVCAMGAFSAMNLWYFFSGRASYPVNLYGFYLERKMLGPILAVGLSAMMLQIMFFVQQAVVFKSLAHYGTERDLAFMGACYRVVVMIVMPIFGFVQAFQPICGINYGAGKYDRVRNAFKTFTLNSTGVVLLVWLFLLLLPKLVMGWMLPDATLDGNDLWNYHAMMLTLPLFPVFFMGTTMFQAIGNAKAALILQVSRELGLYVPTLLILPLYFGVAGIYVSGVPVNIILVFVTILMISREFKRLDKEGLPIKTRG